MSQIEENRKTKILELKAELELKDKEITRLRHQISQMHEGLEGFLKANQSKVTPEDFLKHLNKLPNIDDWYGSLDKGQNETRYYNNYNWHKDILANWNFERYEKTIKEYSKIIGVPYFIGFSRVIYDLMKEYNEMYEYAMKIPNDLVYRNADGELASVGRSCCMMHEDTVNAPQDEVTYRKLI